MQEGNWLSAPTEITSIGQTRFMRFLASHAAKTFFFPQGQAGRRLAARECLLPKTPIPKQTTKLPRFSTSQKPAPLNQASSIRKANPRQRLPTRKKCEKETFSPPLQRKDCRSAMEERSPGPNERQPRIPQTKQTSPLGLSTSAKKRKTNPTNHEKLPPHSPKPKNALAGKLRRNQL